MRLLAIVAAIVLTAKTANAEELEVVVTGEAAPTAERADPTPPAYVLRGDALKAPGRSTADTLATAAGVQVTRRGGSADLATLSLRGSTNAQAPIYLAGMRLNDELTGTVDLSTLPLWMMHRVEIYRGHAPASVDELGVGGAVLLEPRLPSRREAIRASASLGVGSFGQRHGRANIALGGANAGASFSISHHYADDDYTFVDDGGTRFDRRDDVVRRRDNADHRDTDVWAIGRVRLRPVTVSTVVSGFDREAGAPGLSLIGADRARARRRRWLGGLSLALGETNDTWQLHGDVGALTTRYRLSDPERELGFSREIENRGTRHNQRLRLTWRPDPRLAMTLGGSLTRGSLHLDADDVPLQRSARTRLRPAFSVLAQPINRLALSGVVALTHHATTAIGGDQSVLVPAGRVGARFAVTEHIAALANVGRYARVPTLGELYGVAAGVLGNAELRPETGWSADVGVGFERAVEDLDFYAQLVAFVRVADDLIAYRRSALGVVRPYNIGEARVPGIEGVLGATVWNTLAASVSLTSLDPRDVSDARETTADLIPLQARFVASPRIEVRSPRWSTIALDRATLGATVAYRSSRVADPAGLIVLDEQARLDLDVSLAFAERATLRGRLSNVLDERVFDVVGYPLPGRAVYADLEVQL